MNYHRFRRWQQAEPHYVNRHQDTVQHCHNCGTEFRDNFCPRCGQRAEVGRVGWNSIRENIALLWGLDSRSLTYTLVQLLGRPGYLVRDYISGHRQVSFPPVKMLVIVCLFVVIFESVFHVKNDVLGIKFNIQELDNIVGWINAQKSWATLFLQSFYILPTWLLFRYAPGYPRHTLPEGFFPASIHKCPESPLSILWLLERKSRTRTLDNLHVHYLPPALRLWLVEYAVAIDSRHTIGTNNDDCHNSDY